MDLYRRGGGARTKRLEGGETNQDILHEKNVFNQRKMIFYWEC